MSQIYKVNTLSDNRPFQIKLCGNQCLTSIEVDAIHLLEFMNCLPEEDNVFIYEDNRIKLYRDPSMILTWHDEMMILSKEDTPANGEQIMTIGKLLGTNELVIYLGKGNTITPNSRLMTMLPKGLGFFPINMDHILPIKLNFTCPKPKQSSNSNIEGFRQMTPVEVSFIGHNSKSTVYYDDGIYPIVKDSLDSIEIKGSHHLIMLLNNNNAVEKYYLYNQKLSINPSHYQQMIIVSLKGKRNIDYYDPIFWILFLTLIAFIIVKYMRR